MNEKRKAILEEIEKVEASLAIDNDYLVRKKRFLLYKRLRNLDKKLTGGTSLGTLNIALNKVASVHRRRVFESERI